MGLAMKKKWYVEFQNTECHQDFNPIKLVAFKTSLEPTHSFPYDDTGRGRGPCIGPFKTKRAAVWAATWGYMNPHFQHVDDAERLSKTFE